MRHLAVGLSLPTHFNYNGDLRKSMNVYLRPSCEVLLGSLGLIGLAYGGSENTIASFSAVRRCLLLPIGDQEIISSSNIAAARKT